MRRQPLAGLSTVSSLSLWLPVGDPLSCIMVLALSRHALRWLQQRRSALWLCLQTGQSFGSKLALEQHTGSLVLHVLGTPRQRCPKCRAPGLHPTRGIHRSECVQLLWRGYRKRKASVLQESVLHRTVCTRHGLESTRMRRGSLLSACASAVSTPSLLQLPLPSRDICCVQRVAVLVVVCGPVCCRQVQGMSWVAQLNDPPCLLPRLGVRCSWRGFNGRCVQAGRLSWRGPEFLVGCLVACGFMLCAWVVLLLS